MNKQIKDLALTSMFLGITALLSVLQIPVASGLGLSLDFSFISLLISRRYIGLSASLVISLIFPWFTLVAPGGSGSLPGVLSLIIISVTLLLFDYLFNKNNYKVIGIATTILLITLIAILTNVFLIAPMFSGFDNYYNDFFNQAIIWLIVSLIFNPVKLIIIYTITWIIWVQLRRLDE